MKPVHSWRVLSHFSTTEPPGTWLTTNARTPLPASWLFAITSGAGPMEASTFEDEAVSSSGRGPSLP